MDGQCDRGLDGVGHVLMFKNRVVTFWMLEDGRLGCLGPDANDSMWSAIRQYAALKCEDLENSRHERVAVDCRETDRFTKGAVNGRANQPHSGS